MSVYVSVCEASSVVRYDRWQQLDPVEPGDGLKDTNWGFYATTINENRRILEYSLQVSCITGLVHLRVLETMHDWKKVR